MASTVTAVAALTAVYVGGWSIAAGAVAVVAVVAGSTLLLSRRLTAALQWIPEIAAKAGQSEVPQFGLLEFDDALGALSQHVSHWDEVAANSREQARELQAILTLLDRRVSGNPVTGSQLRSVLSGIGQRLQRLLSQIEQSTVEIGRCTQAVAQNAEVQGNAVVKTSTYVEQLTASIDSVCKETEQIHVRVAENGQTIGEALRMVQEITQGMERMRTRSEASERKLRALDDPTRQIRSIVDSIADLAGRTDLLALNAAVESVRAGEHGRGFAIVADEVRKLAEQQSQATREVTVLLEALQMQTQESIARLVQERTDVESESSLGTAAEGVLEKISRNLDADATQAKKITATGAQQRQLAQEVVLAVEQISELAKADRDQAEGARWAMKSLAKTALELDESIDPLHKCRDQHRGDPAENGSTQPTAFRQILESEARPELPINAEPNNKSSANPNTANENPHDPHPPHTVSV